MFALTANRLTDGAVVWYSTQGFWEDSCASARIVTDKTDSAALDLLQAGQRAAGENLIVTSELVEMTMEGGTTVPLRLRERIRALGPTTGNSVSASRHVSL